MSIVRIKNISKKYSIGLRSDGYITLREKIAGFVKIPVNLVRRKEIIRKKIFWALKDINLSIEKGEIVGIIGTNGAGKSTLLKILSQITYPTSGSIEIVGRVASLLEAGTGFNPELTGRENIYLNGAILGMSKKEIEKNFQSIIDFSGVGTFIDTPVKRYSSGMFVRLAFAVAAHLKTDILLVDEVLAVGDIAFQRKCLGKMNEAVEKDDRTILFVSHDMGAIQKLCSRCILLDDGKIVFDGATDKAIDKYLYLMDKKSDLTVSDIKKRQGTGDITFSDIETLGLKSEKRNYLNTGKPFEIKASFKNNSKGKTAKNVSFVFSIIDQICRKQVLVFWTETSGSNMDIEKSNHYVKCIVSNCPLIYGDYVIGVSCLVNGILSDHIEDVAKINVDDSQYFKNGIRPHEEHAKYVVDHEWEVG